MRNSANSTIKKEYTEGVPGHVIHARYFYFDTESAKGNSLGILCGGYEKCAMDFELNRKNFPFYTVEFTVRGKGSFACHGKTYPLRYGTLTGYGPKAPHHFKTDPADPMEHIFIIFMGQDAGKLFEKSILHSVPSILVSNPDLTLSIMEHILKIGFDKSARAEEIICNYLRAILLEQTDSPLAVNPNRLSLENFQRCKNYLDHHFETIHSSSQLAEECSLNIRYIARLFKRYKQMRPHKYLIQLKMNKAANLLLTTTLSIKQVAQMIGLEDPYHFSRLFKKSFKKAPSQYRQSFIKSR